MTDILTQTGKKLTVRKAPFSISLDLKDAIEKALLGSNIDISSIELKENFSDFAGSEMNLLLRALMTIDSNAEVKRILFLCLERCSYQNEKIDLNLFDAIDEAREDYYEIVFNCLKENLRPFFGILFSKLKNQVRKPHEEKSQNSAQTPQ